MVPGNHSILLAGRPGVLKADILTAKSAVSTRAEVKG
jgi:hypothetical protein